MWNSIFPNFSVTSLSFFRLFIMYAVCSSICVIDVHNWSLEPVLDELTSSASIVKLSRKDYNFSRQPLIRQGVSPLALARYVGGLPARRGAKCRSDVQKRNSHSLSVRVVFLCLGHSNRAICSLLSQFCFVNFQKISLSYWGPILITPHRGRL